MPVEGHTLFNWLSFATFIQRTAEHKIGGGVFHAYTYSLVQLQPLSKLCLDLTVPWVGNAELLSIHMSTN